jgi:hypothetical protein
VKRYDKWLWWQYLSPSAIYWRLFIVRLALRWIPRLNIGDAVMYQGRRYWLSQGVCAPKWNIASKTEYLKDIDESEFRKVQTPRAWWSSFKFGYRFYMTSWWSIWRGQGIQPWMLGCRIWAGEPPRATSTVTEVPK